MSLSTALLLLALALLAALGLQLWWKTRRAARREAVVTSAKPGRDARDARHPNEARDSRIEPALGDTEAEAGDTIPLLDEALRLPARRTARIDALIDAIVPLTLDAPVSGEAVLAHLPSTRRAGSKPFLIEGLDTETGEWEAPTPGRRYGELQAGVQLSNRSGPLNEIEYSEFLHKLGDFAEALGTPLDGAAVPDMLEVVARAREIDGLASPLDAQLTLTLRSNGVAWAVPYVQQVAARHGFVAGSVPGRLVLPADEDGAPPLLVLAVDAQAAMASMESDAAPEPGTEAGAVSVVTARPSSAAVREAQLVLDLAQSAEALEPYPAWHRMATALSEDLDATPVDDGGVPLTLHAFDAIAREVHEVYRRLETLDLAAGSPTARRLFS